MRQFPDKLAENLDSSEMFPTNCLRAQTGWKNSRRTAWGLRQAGKIPDELPENLGNPEKFPTDF